MGTSKRGVRPAAAGLVAVAFLLVFALPAWANAPNPGTTTVDQVVQNPDGSTTVTVQGTWTWASQTKCSTARNGVGYQVDWFDNTSNAIGTSASPNGILYVGTPLDNIVHSVETLGGSSAIGNAFYNGVPSSYLAHHTTDTTPNKTDAQHWFSQCNHVNSSGVTAGTWGPITHTYAATATQPLKLCPILYDPHGGHDNSGQSSVKDVTAGASSSSKTYNDDNSYQTNGTGPNGNSCPAISIPKLTTRASSSSSLGAIHDTATLTGATGRGRITFKLYKAGSGCSGAPLFTSSVSTSGDGDYSSGDYTPTSAGSYQWQAGYSSATVKTLLTTCGDPNEVSTVSRPGSPGIAVKKLASVPCSALPGKGITPKPSQPKGVLPCQGSSTVFTPGTITVEVPRTGGYSILVNYEIQVTNTGAEPLVLTLHDLKCENITGPVQVSGTLVGDTLYPNGRAIYTCSHTLTASDGPGRFSSYRNTATVVGTPPSGPPVQGTSSVTTAKVHPSPVPPSPRYCRSLKTGKRVLWRRHHAKPRACRPQPGPHGRGFTG